jgi:hypothetical protein
MFKGVIESESNCGKKIRMSTKVTSDHKNWARKLNKHNRLKQTSSTTFSFIQRFGVSLTIDTRLKECSCEHFCDKAMCKHLVPACLLQKISMNGLEFKTSLRIARRKLQPQLNDSLSDGDVQDRPNEPITSTQVADAPVIFDAPPSPVKATEAKRKRGRPPKATLA